MVQDLKKIVRMTLVVHELRIMSLERGYFLRDLFAFATLTKPHFA